MLTVKGKDVRQRLADVQQADDLAQQEARDLTRRRDADGGRPAGAAPVALGLQKVARGGAGTRRGQEGQQQQRGEGGAGRHLPQAGWIGGGVVGWNKGC
jgi:hypothetical protein